LIGYEIVLSAFFGFRFFITAFTSLTVKNLVGIAIWYPYKGIVTVMVSKSSLFSSSKVILPEKKKSECDLVKQSFVAEFVRPS